MPDIHRLRASERLYRSLIENISVGVFRTTPAGQIIMVNPAAAFLFGYASAQEVMGTSAGSFYADPSDRQLFLRHLESEDGHRPIEFQLKRKDGTIIWCTLTAARVQDENGTPIFIDGTVEDITERRRAEELLRQQNRYMKSLHDIMLTVISRVQAQDVLETILNRTIELMKTIHGFFYTYEETSNALVLRVGAGIYENNVGFTVNKGEGLAGKVWQSEAPIVINDYPSWPGRHPDRLWDSVYSVVGVPLKSKDRFLGVIGYLHPERGRQIESHEIDLLNRFAELATIALDNAQLYAKLDEELQERRRIEAALTKSEERYRSVVEDLAAFVLRWRPNGSVIFANDVYCKYKERSKSEVIGNNIQNLFSAPAVEQAREIIARLNADHPLEINDISTLGPDSRPIWEEWTDRGIFDKSGNLIEIQSVGRDITERKLAEKALRESEFRFRSLFNSSPDGIILVDLDGNILDANKRLLDFTGYSLDQLRGLSYQALTHPKYHSEIAGRIDDLLSGRADDAPLEIEYVNKAVAGIPVAVRGWVVTDEQSRPVALGGFIRNITREKSLASDKAALENQLRQTQKMEAIGTLAGGIAHDFNNILAGIIGYAELALSELPDSDTNLNHYVTRVLYAGNRAKSLVQQILKFSRKSDAALMPLSVSPLLKEAIKLLRSILPATIRIKESIMAEPDTVVADATQLHQVIMNLCTNAYHAMRESGGTLTVSLENQQIAEPRYFLASKIAPGDYVKLSVRDTGHGISAEILDRIFEPYFTTKQMHEGTGLGLSVTFGIVKNLHGLIEVEHTSPETTTFAVYLPLRKEVGTDGTEIVHQLPTGNNENVLCVDDENIFLEVVQKHLEDLGYRVTAYHSSVRALEHFKSNPTAYDLIITDQMMPEMTGIQLSAEIRKLNQTIPILLCTGYSEAVTASTTEKFGISSFLMKPVTRKELAKSVYGVLQNLT